MLPSWCEDTITVLRAPWVSQRGTKVRDWGSAEPHEVSGCSVQPSTTATADPSARALSTSVGAVAYCPPGADVEAGDRIVFDGATYDVEGEPLRVRSPFGGCDHMLVNLTARRG